MKILFTPSDNNMAGAFQSMVRLCTILKNEYGCEILVLLRKGGTGQQLLDENQIPYVKIRSFNWIVPDEPTSAFRRIELFVRTVTKPFAKIYNRYAQKKIAQLIRKEKFDFVHLNTTYIYVPALAALECKVPFVWHLREFLEEDQKKKIWDKKYGYALISKANAVITISNSLYQKYKEILPAKSLYKIYNGLDENYYYCPNHKILSNNKVKLLMVGTINEAKGQIQAIDACSSLLVRGIEDFELCIVGDITKYASALKKHVEDTGLKEYVKFVGQKRDTVSYYNQSDIVLVCSRFEAFGRVTVEAMMGGCLVIGSNTGGTVELIENENTGILYSYGNSEELADKIEIAIKNVENSRQMAARGQKFMMENMTASINAENIYQVYRSILEKDQ